MPEIIADPPLPSCYHLFPRREIREFQQLGSDPFLPRGRDARGRFATGSSGNPRGRPRGISRDILRQIARVTHMGGSASGNGGPRAPLAWRG